jgi:hypothetical protein
MIVYITVVELFRYVIDDSSRINSLCYRYHGWHGSRTPHCSNIG